MEKEDVCSFQTFAPKPIEILLAAQFHGGITTIICKTLTVFGQALQRMQGE